MDDDIIEEILLRVPEKSLINSKSLSKKWCDFISCNKSFLNRYIDRNRGRQEYQLAGVFYTKAFHSTDPNYASFLPTTTEGRTRSSSSMLLKNRKRKSYDNNNVLGVRGLLLLPPDELLTSLGVGRYRRSTNILGSSNGFLLTSLEEAYNSPMQYFVCNPVNKQWVALPLPTPNNTNDWMTWASIAHGFIFHATQYNRMPYYKVVRVLGAPPGAYSTTLTIEIFSSELPNPEWKLFNISAPFYFNFDIQPRSIVISQKGVIYFRGCVAEGETRPRRRLAFFDQNKGGKYLLQQIDFPEDEENNHCFDLSDGLIVYASKLGHQLNIWVLNDESKSTREWSLRHKISFVFPRDFVIEAFHPLNPQVIFLATRGKRFSYNVENSRLALLSKGATEGRYELYPYTYGLVGSHLLLDS